MRSTIAATAAFAAGVLAVPFAKRDIVTDYDIEYVTEIVTVTADAAPATTEAASSAVQQHWGHHWHPYSSSAEPSSATTESSVEVASSTSTYVAPTTSSTYVAPTTSSTYVAPTTSSTYVAPTTSSTYVAPSSTSAAPSSSAVPTSSSSTADASGAAPTSFEEITVYHHNLHRSNHSAQAIVWNDTLASIAMDIAQTCSYEHQMDFSGGGYGQNIAAGVPANNISATITDLFYNGEVGWFDGLYGQAQPDMTNFEHFGHFTQIVWKDTVSVGCASYDCSGRPHDAAAGAPEGLGNVSEDTSPIFTVCNYYPPGNYGGEYADNIGASNNDPTVDWNANGYTVASDATSQS